MKVEINMTRVDFLKWYISSLLPNKKRKGGFLKNLAALIFIFLLFSIGQNRTMLVNAILFLIMILVFLIVNLILMIIRVITMPTSAGLLGDHVIEITPEGLRESTSFNDGFDAWKGVKVVYENKNYIFIELGSGSVHIIPKRAFSSRDEAKQFYETAEKYWEEQK